MPNVGVYIPDALDQRVRRLKEKGVEVPVSVICRRCLEATVEAEEKALKGDRMTRLIARVERTRTAEEQAVADGEAAGRQWAEDVAARSEMEAVRALDAEFRGNPGLDVAGVWIDDADGLVHAALSAHEAVLMPSSVPHDFFAGLADPRASRYSYQVFRAFLRGASAVLNELETALKMRHQQQVLERAASDPVFLGLQTFLNTRQPQRRSGSRNPKAKPKSSESAEGKPSEGEGD